MQAPVDYKDPPNYEAFAYVKEMPKLNTGNPKVEQYLSSGTATKLSVPSIAGHSWLNENMTIRLTVTNNNSVAAVFHGTLYDTAYDDAYGSISTTISANSTKTVDIALDSSFGEGIGCYVQAYFTADGYNQSSTTKYVAE